MKKCSALGYSIFLSLSFVCFQYANAEPNSGTPAPLTSKAVSCSAPRGFAGQSASILGTLKLQHTETGAYSATGLLLIQMAGATSAKTLDEKIQVVGQYDLLVGGDPARRYDYATLGSQRYESLYVHLDFIQAEDSYIEYNGKKYLTDCTKGP